MSARLVLLVLTFVSLAAVAFVCVEPPASSACPVIPKPLRVMYEDSALVAVVRVGDSVAVSSQGHSTLTKTALRISSLLKGESKERVVNLYHHVWRDVEGDSFGAYEKNDVLLVFLTPGENGDGYLPADYARGVKKLPPDDLKVYVRRLEELALIMRSEKPDAAALTEWLVRCAEEPATRWEGAFELASSDSSLAAPVEESGGADSDAVAANTGSLVAVVNTDAEQAKPDGESAEQAATNAANIGVNESGERVEPNEFISDSKAEEINFAALLTPAHKERLATALLAAEELDEGEQMLLPLVANWKDARLVPFCLKHLARLADKPPYHAEDLMRIVAHTLEDRTLIKFVDDYSKAASYNDLYSEDEDYSEAEEEDSEATAEERAATKKEIAELKAAAAEARFGRSGKLRHFLALADQPQKP